MHIDVEAVVAHLYAGEVDRAAAISGLDLDLARLKDLLGRGQPHSFEEPVDLYALVAIAIEAAHSKVGIAFLLDTTPEPKAPQCLAIRLGDRVTLAVRRPDRRFLGHVRPWVPPLFPDLARSRPGLVLWSQEEERGQDAIRLHIGAVEARERVEMEVMRAAVLANPQDDAPRLVMADWLLERGDPHGELIQLQCHDAGTSHRALDLLDAHGCSIAGGLGEHTFEYSIRRGFVESVCLDRITFERHGSRLLSVHPITDLELRSEFGFADLRVPAALDQQLRSLRLTPAQGGFH